MIFGISLCVKEWTIVILYTFDTFFIRFVPAPVDPIGKHLFAFDRKQKAVHLRHLGTIGEIIHPILDLINYDTCFDFCLCHFSTLSIIVDIDFSRTPPPGTTAEGQG